MSRNMDNNPLDGVQIPQISLELLKEAVGLNKGSIQFVSYSGYLAIEGGDETFEPLEYPFPGTAVCIKFLTNDKNTYYFTDELDPKRSDIGEN